MDKETGTVRAGMKLTPSEWKALQSRINKLGWSGYIRSLIIKDMGDDFPNNIAGVGAPKRYPHR